MSAALQLHDVALTYATRAGNISALAEVSLDVAEGEFVAILGLRVAVNRRFSSSLRDYYLPLTDASR